MTTRAVKDKRTKQLLEARIGYAQMWLRDYEKQAKFLQEQKDKHLQDCLAARRELLELERKIAAR